MVKQVGLLPAGCQPWNHDVCAASGDRFAYCATLAIYVYEVMYSFSGRFSFKLTMIMKIISVEELSTLIRETKHQNMSKGNKGYMKGAEVWG